ncbi:hypothetical protein P7K49_020036, partial [Saguinus oedipus]
LIVSEKIWLPCKQSRMTSNVPGALGAVPEELNPGTEGALMLTEATPGIRPQF